MFDWLKKDATPPPGPQVPEVLGLHLGGAVELNDLKLRLLEGQFTFANAAKTQIIQALGVVDLGDASHLLRFYTDDDGFLQVFLKGGMREENIEEVKLWFYYETQGIDTKAAWDDCLAHGISRSHYELDGKRFTRVWQGMGADSPPVAMTERTYTEEGESSTDQFVMLYERPVTEGLTEYLLVSGEETFDAHDNPSWCLVTSTGVDLSSADFEVVS